MESIGKAARVERVQAELGLRVPPDYAEFLVRYGHAEIEGLPIYGYSQDMADVEAVPSVIGATRRLRPIHGLRSEELVLAQTNGSLIVLDCADGMVLEVDCLERRWIVARSFDLWVIGLKQEEGRDGG